MGVARPGVGSRPCCATAALWRPSSVIVPEEHPVPFTRLPRPSPPSPNTCPALATSNLLRLCGFAYSGHAV